MNSTGLEACQHLQGTLHTWVHVTFAALIVLMRIVCISMHACMYIYA